MLAVRAVTPDEWRQWRDVRLAALAEAPYAFTTRYEEWRDAEERRWRDRLALPGSTCLLATVDGTAAGIAGGVTTDEPGVAELVAMWVAPAARGRGVGDALVGAVADWATATGASRLRLEVAAGNHAAAALYARNGFTRTERAPQRGACEFVMERAL
jgi:GNAT superfamily N-acetyltransferase